MKKKLPNLYVNKIEKKLNNNDVIFYSSKKEKEPVITTPNISHNNELQDVGTKINELFNSPNYVYKMNVTIMLKDKSIINKDIIGQVGKQLITIDEDSINIDDISEIRF